MLWSASCAVRGSFGEEAPHAVAMTTALVPAPQHARIDLVKSKVVALKDHHGRRCGHCANLLPPHTGTPPPALTRCHRACTSRPQRCYSARGNQAVPTRQVLVNINGSVTVFELHRA